MDVILSVDVEEHHRIESAARLSVPASSKATYCKRMSFATDWILEQLAERNVMATFFVLGELACNNSDLIRKIARAGHEIASHGWDHKRLHTLTPSAFRHDILRTKDTLEQITGSAVLGYRAPTFSIVRETAWALEILAEAGYLYDSSIYPVRHDRYGVPAAPRAPFFAMGETRSILEIPPATLRFLNANVPIGGGGYFRLLPLRVMMRGIRQTERECCPPVAMLYFHPWEFDPEQPRLPLRGLDRFRTYVGITRSRDRLKTLLQKFNFRRAMDVANLLLTSGNVLQRFGLGPTIPGLREQRDTKSSDYGLSPVASPDADH
jgi:polysaccharide deacetylase family protein (PEP-CTERM system associated)